MSNSDIVFTGESKRCLVLGGRGFIGSHLVDALLNAGNFVRCFDRAHVSTLGEDHLANPNFELYEGDLTCEADIAEALEGCNICYHLVSTTLPKSSNADPIFDVESNLLGTIRVLTHAVKAGVKKIIFVSSGGTVYGVPTQIPILETHQTEPICSYGVTKLAIEKYLALFKQLHGLDYTVLRIANPYGERQRIHASQGAVAVFLGKVLQQEPIEIWGDGSVVRDYVYISDVVDALLAVIDPTENEHVFNIGSDRGLSLNEVLEQIEFVTGQIAVKRYMPSRVFDVSTNILSIERAKHLLRWSPKVDFQQGIALFAKWLLQHPNIE